jgi:hypothetical protein
VNLTKVNCKYGAPMGRAHDGIDGFTAFAASEFAGKVRLARVRLDSGGYDSGGAYWGTGVPLWRAECDYTDGSESVDYFLRAADRESAKRELQSHAQARYGTLRFFR